MADKCQEMLLKIGGLSHQDIGDVLHFVDHLRNDPNRGTKVKAAAQALIKDAELAKRQAALQASAQTRFLGRHLQWALDALGKGRAGRKVKSLYSAGSAFLVGNNKDMVGGRFSLDYLAKAAGRAAVNEFDQAVKRLAGPSWTKLAKNKEFTLDLVKEMGGEDSHNPLAKGLAKLLMDRFSRGVKLLNSAGANITELDKYRFTQNQVAGKVANAGHDQWVQDMKPLLDLPRMFPAGTSAEDIHTALGSIYDDIVNMKYQDPFKYTPSASLATRVSQHRSLHFKDAQAAVRANELYGHDLPIYNMVQHLERQMHDYKLMESLGPNPDKFYTWMKQTLINKALETKTEFSQFDQNTLDNDFNVIMNRHNQTASYNSARVWGAIRAGTMMAHLGFSTVSSFTDALNGMFAVHRAGLPVYKTAGYAFKTFLKFATGRAAVDKEYAQELHSAAVGMDAARHYIASRWDTGDGGIGGIGKGIPEKMARAQGVFFKLNLQAYWDDVWKFGTAHALMNHYAASSGKAFTALGTRAQRSLEAAGIDSAMWDDIRSTEHTVLKGNHFISPDKIQNSAARDRYQTMLLSEAERTVPLPGARQTVTLFGTRGKRGEIQQEFLHTLMMFKSFPLGVVQKVWPNIQDGGFPAVLTAVFGSIMVGYMENSIKNALTGKEPDDLGEFHTWMEAAAAGGMGSLFSDIFSDQPLPETGGKLLGGPVAPTALRVGNIAWEAAVSHKNETRGQAAAEAALQVAKTDVPFTNLWFTKALYQYGMIYPLMEASHPGSVRKSVDDAERKYKTQYWWKPKQAQQ